MMVTPYLGYVRAASKVFAIPVDDIIARSRKADLVEARHAVMLVMRERGCSFPQIAWEIGMKDHTTVMHGVKKARAKIASDNRFRRACEALRRAA